MPLVQDFFILVQFLSGSTQGQGLTLDLVLSFGLPVLNIVTCYSAMFLFTLLLGIPGNWMFELLVGNQGVESTDKQTQEQFFTAGQ